MTNPKKVREVVVPTPQQLWVGETFPWVGGVFPLHNPIDYHGIGVHLNPFIMLDYVAPFDFWRDTLDRGFSLHPHRGCETVTIVFQGAITHTDNTGATDTIYPGDVQWMTAGSGIEHSETLPENNVKQGGTLEMLQLWVNLPAKDKMTKPGYQAITSKVIPTVPLVDNNGTVDVIAGEYKGKKGPATTFTPMTMLSVKLDANSTTTLTVPDGWVGAILVRRGKVTINGHKAAFKDLVAFEREGSDIVASTSEATEFVFFAGEPINEPIAAYGPMVMNTQDEVRKAFSDYQSGKFIPQ